MDTTGEQHLKIDHNVYKRRLDLSGKPLEDPKRTSESFQMFLGLFIYFYLVKIRILNHYT